MNNAWVTSSGLGANLESLNTAAICWPSWRKPHCPSPSCYLVLISVPPLAVRAMVIAAGRQALWDRIGRELVASSANLQKAGWSPQVETKAGLRAMVRAALNAPPLE
jgi:hypothetical protein